MTLPTPAWPTHPPRLPAGSAAGPESTDRPEPADVVVAAVLALPGVVDMHPGMFGEVATYLPGRRVPGVQVREDDCQVHVVLRYSTDIHRTADEIRAVVEPIVHTSVHVTIQDLVEDDLARDKAGRAHHQ